MKDSAFLFYSKDFYEGTRMMFPEERACYIDLLIYQHQNGIIPFDLKRVSMFCNGIDIATLEATLEAKFEQTESGWVCNGKFFQALKYKSGNEHWNWKGGVNIENKKYRTSSKYVKWKKKVLKRDGYKCQKCDSKDKLHVHHVKPYSKFKNLRIDVSNGITFCQNCHIDYHKTHPVE